jgi:hypothetical protein
MALTDFSNYSNGAGGPAAPAAPDKFADAPAAVNVGRGLKLAGNMALRTSMPSLISGLVGAEVNGAQPVARDLAAGMSGTYTPAAAPPSKAASSAGSAASDALKATTFSDARFDATNPKGNGPVGSYARTTQEDNASAWNTWTGQQIANITGQTPAAVQATLAQPLPQWGKMGPDGGGTTNFDTTNGAQRRVNAGYGSQIVASGATQVRDTGDGRLHTRNNNFSGVGMGGLPGGAAAVLTQGQAPGAQASGDPMQGAMADYQKFMSQAADQRARGDGLGAKSSEIHAARLLDSFQKMSEREYQQGMVGVGKMNATTQQNLARGPVAANALVTEALINHKNDDASQIRAADKGTPLHAAQQIIPSMSTNPFTGNAATDRDVMKALQELANATRKQ